ncbi:uncharacterized protein LOC111313355 isoform X1 [Durio zibethinus]|uniref:Uncharacterized protein LOC111313355 isoform X1 n=1 Tax=Durio zibethinus TaxID=66656 RepID=A0A6P6AYA1_DURZI|nr:uncharacterized protein LOC111313355 isoform X1 [Durio zibethinus]
MLLLWSYFKVVFKDPGSVPENWRAVSAEENLEVGSSWQLRMMDFGQDHLVLVAVASIARMGSCRGAIIVLFQYWTPYCCCLVLSIDLMKPRIIPPVLPSLQ